MYVLIKKKSEWFYTTYKLITRKEFVSIKSHYERLA